MSIWDETAAMNDKRRMRWQECRALRNWRLSLPNPTLVYAGKLLGVSESQMSRYENGWRRVLPENVLHYEAITGIPREELRPDLYGPPLRGRRGAKVS